ncbi:hypothetical protein ABC766_00305 [Methylobacterium fujisawaense]|jgi:hypothetical protein|uniref:structural cement protein Gp24 n=1 Tax=Methylobacterium fujisawaense TaxID=107400 RepID=UPI0031F48D02
MPALQTSYGPYLTPAFAGMVADMRPNTVISREVEGNVSLPFGAVTLRGATDHGCGPFGLANAKGFLGIAVFSASVRPTNPTLNAYAPAGASSVTGADTAAICTRGPVWVNVAVAVTNGDDAYYDASGNITNVSTSNTAMNGKFETTTSGAGLAILVLR